MLKFILEIYHHAAGYFPVYVHALEKGLKRNEANGQLKRYMDKLYFTNPDAGNIRIYAEKVWIFSEDKLVTVFGISKGLKDQANTQIKRKSRKENYMGN